MSAVEGAGGGEVWVVGDVHGCYEVAVDLLRRHLLIDTGRHWTGGRSTVWFIGDLMDRGPQGLESVDLVMRLQQEAAAAGGRVGCLAGNHEVMMIGARRFLERPLGLGDVSFLELWTMNGGKARDLQGMTDEHMRWIMSLPAVAREGPYLLVHADSPFYVELGDSVDTVNTNLVKLVAGDRIDAWGALISEFVRRNELSDETPEGAAALDSLLGTFGGEIVVHGHTPIPLITHQEPAAVATPLVYSGGRCINVDGGMFLGSPGVAYRLGEDAGGRKLRS